MSSTDVLSMGKVHVFNNDYELRLDLLKHVDKDNNFRLDNETKFYTYKITQNIRKIKG